MDYGAGNLKRALSLRPSASEKERDIKKEEVEKQLEERERGKERARSLLSQPFR